MTAATIDDAMTKNPTTTHADELAASLLSTLNERQFTQIFVVDADVPIGVVHMHDILKAGVS